MDLKVIANGIPVPTREEEGAGWVDLVCLVTALGAPLQVIDGHLMVKVRPLLDAGVYNSYDSATGIMSVGKAQSTAQPPPLPELPAEPVGADVQPRLPVTAPICSSPGDRRPELLERVIRQFQVARNARLVPRQGNTYCNIFLWDVTRAMGAEIPHWVDQQGRPSKAGAGAWEMDANAVCAWLAQHGADYGWKPVSAELALLEANAGRPAVAVWVNLGGIGHVAVVRPGQMSSRGVPIAQAGATNFDDGFLVDGFGSSRVGAVRFYVHE